MSNKSVLLLLTAFFFSYFHLAYAAVVINEIMYNVPGVDTDHEWVEIFNNSSADSVDLSGWKFNDGSNHNLNQPPANGGQGSLLIAPGAYAIFSGNAATFISDHPGYSRTVIDTVMSLPNTSATLQLIKSDNSVADSVTYNSSQGANEDGNSLQKVSGSWVGRTPTPGATNETAAASNAPIATGALANGTPDSSNSSTQTATATETKKTVEEPKIRTKITAPSLIFVGNPAPFQAAAWGLSKEKLYYGKYFWNFGDGYSRETQVSSTEKISHIYSYSGDYVVTLEYYKNSYGETSDASDQVTVKVVRADLVISRVGDERDFFVELSNNADYDADISGWMLAGSTRIFTFPKNTILGSQKKIIFSSRITNFSVSDKNDLKLFNPQRETVFDYGASLIPVPPVKAEPEKVENKAAEKFPENQNETLKNETKTETLPNEIPAENLGASVAASGAIKDSLISFPSIVALLFIGTSAGAVYFIRHRRNISKAGDDFKILDE